MTSLGLNDSGKGNKGVGIVLALIVFVILLFVVIGKDDTNTKVGVKELKVEKVDKDAVQKIEVTLPPKKAAGDAGPEGATAGAAKRIVLEKSGDAWKVWDADVADKKFDVDDGQIKSALDAIGEFATGDLIANKKEKHAELEIDDEKGQLVRVTAKGKTALELVFGRAAKGGGSTVRQKDSNDVFVAKGRLGSVLKKEVGAWRKKALFDDLKADDITRVAITNADGSRIVVEGTPPPPPAPDAPDAGPSASAAAAKTEWKLVEPSAAALPEGFRLDKAQLARPAASFASLRAQDFADGTTDATAGFDAPHTIVEASTGSAGGKKITVHFGKEDDKKRVYAKVDGDPQIYLVAGYSAKQLQKTVDDLRELTLLDARIDDVEKVTIKGTAATVVVQKKGEEWELVEPKTPPPDFEATQIAGQIAGILRARAARVANDAPATAFAPVGGKPPGPVVEVSLKGGKKQTLKFGAPVPLDAEEKAKAGDDKKKLEPREYYVKGAVDDLTYVIAAFSRNRYDKPTELFKKPPGPPPGMGGGAIPGMEGLPPEVRKKLEESMKKGELPAGHP